MVYYNMAKKKYRSKKTMKRSKKTARRSNKSIRKSNKHKSKRIQRKKHSKKKINNLIGGTNGDDDYDFNGPHTYGRRLKKLEMESTRAVAQAGAQADEILEVRRLLVKVGDVIKKLGDEKVDAAEILVLQRELSKLQRSIIQLVNNTKASSTETVRVLTTHDDDIKNIEGNHQELLKRIINIEGKLSPLRD